MLAETIEFLQPAGGGVFVDCTFGRGGHTRALLAELGDSGRVIAIDRDPSAIESGRETLIDTRLTLVHARFSSMEDLIEAHKLREQADGILMDLGVSSPQLDNAERGFSFRADGPLDMRMDPSQGVSAATWLASATEKEIRECLWAFGEERFARRIARKIVEIRQTHRLETTQDLVAAIAQAVPKTKSRIDPATRTFQALRLHVNAELDELSRGLAAACRCLKVGGRVAVIAFHSLEDRIVKRMFRDLSRAHDPFLGPSEKGEFKLITRKPLRPSDDEIARNARSRSARLRVLERTA